MGPPGMRPSGRLSPRGDSYPRSNSRQVTRTGDTIGVLAVPFGMRSVLMNRLIAASIAVAALLPVAAFPRAAARSLPPAGAAALDAFLKEQVDKGVIPGVVAVVVNRAGTLYSGAFGKQNTAKGVALSTDSIFRIASMTKAVTSVAT